MVSPGALVFLALAAVTLISALGVALSRNILYSGFALMGTLAGVAGLYLFIGADFVGIAQLLIYVGGILVLILFAILLTNKITEVNITNLSASVAQGAIAAVALAVILVQAIMGAGFKSQSVEVFTPNTARLGDAFLREYLLPFELASIVLLMALVGAMVIARRAAKEEAPKGFAEDRLD
jgi:NADH-quinone oxidoreductase subunit J